MRRKETQAPPENTAVIYARFSCSKQREASIEDQLRVCREWCRSNGHEVVGEYCDRAMSGRTDDRPEFQRMVANAGEAEVVVVYMMDRFSRDVYDAPIYKRRLKESGVSVVSATESMPDGPESILIEGIYEALAAMESARTAQRVRRGMEGNAIRCMHNGVRVFGYRAGEDGRYVVDEAEAAVVREAFARKAGGESMSSIASDLAERGYTTARGRPCDGNFVFRLLHNEKYLGTYSWGGTVVEGGMPQIVTREEWDMAHARRAAKVRVEEEWHDYAFAGRGVCMGCGESLVGVSGRGRRGVTYHYYRCSRRCGCRNIRADAMESAVVAGIREMLSDRDTAMDLALKAKRREEERRADDSGMRDARRRLEAASRGMENIVRAVEEGAPYSAFSQRMGELGAQRARAERDIERLSASHDLDVEGFVEFLQSGDGLSDRELLDLFVWQVQLGDELCVAVLSYGSDDEPSRIEIPRGFAECASGGPDANLCEPRIRRYGLVVTEGLVAVVLRRAA